MVWLARRSTSPGRWEDVLQDALSVAWRTRAKFDSSRGGARNWLLAIVADQSRKDARRRRPTSQLSEADHAAEPDDLDSDLDLTRALDQLTDRQRTAVVLHYYLALPVLDVAEVMGCSAGTVKSTLFDARGALKRHLGEGYRHD